MLDRAARHAALDDERHAARRELRLGDVARGQAVAPLDERAHAARELLRKAGEYLLSRGAIGRDNPFIWLAGREVQGFPETRPPRAQGNVVPFRRGPADDADLQGIGDLL